MPRKTTAPGIAWEIHFFFIKPNNSGSDLKTNISNRHERLPKIKTLCTQTFFHVLCEHREGPCKEKVFTFSGKIRSFYHIGPMVWNSIHRHQLAGAERWPCSPRCHCPNPSLGVRCHSSGCLWSCTSNNEDPCFCISVCITTRNTKPGPP